MSTTVINRKLQKWPLLTGGLCTEHQNLIFTGLIKTGLTVYRITSTFFFIQPYVVDTKVMSLYNSQTIHKQRSVKIIEMQLLHAGQLISQHLWFCLTFGFGFWFPCAILMFVLAVNVQILCYVMLCYVMLCYVMLCYAMLCYAMLCYAMLKYVML